MSDSDAPFPSSEEGHQADEQPSTIGPYQILDTLGEGGMAVVYLAQQSEPVKRRVALKIIKPGMDSKQVVARFEAERQALALLDHPNIAKIYDGGIAESGRPYFVMELVKGTPITEYCDDHKLSTRERLELFVEVCAGVQHAHQKGLIHRDLKPSNILVDVVDGNIRPRIIDFGVAKATGATLSDETLYTRIGQVIGTPAYMSPEQAGITGLDVDTRTDVYSLGVVLYEMLVGALPLDLRAVGDEAMRVALRERDAPKPSTRITELGDTAEEVARARNVDTATLRKQLSGDLDWVVMCSIAKDRTRRYDTVNALAMECRRYLNHEPVIARPPSPGYLLGRFVRRNRLVVTAGSIAMLAIIGGAVAAAIGFYRASEAEQVALREAETASQVSDFLVELFAVSDPSEARGNTITAREILDRGADRIGAELDSEPEVQATLLNTIGRVYTVMGLYGSAQPLLDEALVLSDSVSGRISAETADVLFNLGELARLKSDYEVAESLHREALEIREALPEPQAEDIAISNHALGLVLYYEGKYDQVEPYFERALQIYANEFDGQHQSVAGVSKSFGSLMHSTNRYEDAERHFSDALRIYRNVYGEVHPEIASTLNNLAITYDEQGRFDEAKAAYEESIAVFRKVYPGDHEFTAETQAHYAALMRYMGNRDLAEQSYREAIDMLERTVGHEHMLTARVKDGFGVLLFTTGRYDEAEPFIADSVAVHRSQLGPRHINTGRALNNMAALLFFKGDYAAAEPWFRESLSIREEVLGEDHADVANSRNNLADLLNRLGRFDEAEPLAEQAARAYASSLSPTHWRAAVARNIHSASLAGLGQYDEAETEMFESLAVIAEAVTGSVYHRMALERAVQLYEAWGDPDKAASWEERLTCLESETDC